MMRQATHTETASLAPVRIGPADPADVPALSALISSLFELEPDFGANDSRQQAGLALLLADPERSLVLKAQAGTRVVGMLTVQLVVSTAQGGWSGLMEDVVVHQDWRRQGLGHQLVAAAEAWLLARGASRMQLLADQHNTAALDFYQGLGYGPTRMVCRRKLFG